MVHWCAKLCNVADACSENYTASNSSRYWDRCQLERIPPKFKRRNKRLLSGRLRKVLTRTTTFIALANSWHNTTVSSSGYQPRKEHQIRTWDVQKGLSCDCFWPWYANFPYVQQSAYVLYASTASAVLIYNSELLLLEINWGRCYVYFDVNAASNTDLRVLRVLISSDGFLRTDVDFLGLQNHHCHAILQPSQSQDKAWDTSKR